MLLAIILLLYSIIQYIIESICIIYTFKVYIFIYIFISIYYILTYYIIQLYNLNRNPFFVKKVGNEYTNHRTFEFNGKLRLLFEIWH